MEQICRSLAIGFFDGVHIGHAALLKKAKERAAETGSVPSVMSFDVHPDNLVFNTEVELISDVPGRKEIIKRCFDIDDVVFLHFNKSTMNMPWQQFADMIISELNVKWFVVGHDFTFGQKGQGNAHRLKEYCAEKGIGCDIIEAVKLDERIVSSTYIRSLIHDGNMEETERYLGHPYCLSDTIHSGYHLGQKLDAPTINMFFAPGVIVPKHGVYATKVIISDNEYAAVTNVGIRPTVGNGDAVSVESHILDFEGNLYGLPARVDFYHFVRPERKFANFDELSAQIHEDAETTRAYFAGKNK